MPLLKYLLSNRLIKVNNSLMKTNEIENIMVPGLYDENDKAVEFEQIALVEVDGIFYCILKPVDCRDVSDDEAWAFEINEEGWVNKRQFVQKANVDEINVKVYEMLKNATIVPKPPLDYTNKPIKIEFGCEANQEEVSCYSKNIVEKNVNNQ